jgi:predicted small lipoprotein YifL
MRRAARIGLFALALLTAGCGQRGPLYLPDKKPPPVTPPPAAPAAQPAPAQPTQTAPKKSDDKDQDDDTQTPKPPPQ